MSNPVNLIDIADVHWQLATPEGRTDSYPDALRAKLNEIFDLAARYKAIGILVNGDLFNTPSVSLAAIGLLAQILTTAPCTVYAIAGQHDEWDHNPDSLGRTPFGLLAAAGLIRDVAANPVIIDLPWTSRHANHAAWLEISGRHYNHQADAEGYYEPPHIEGRSLILPDVRLMLSHGMLLDHEPSIDLKHTLVSELQSSAEVVCVGDYHPGVGIKRFDRGALPPGLVVSPGALARMKASPEEFERPVQAAVLTIDEDDVYAKLIPLECARPGCEVLSREHLERQAQREERMEHFLGLLSAEGETRFLETREIVDDIAKLEKVPAGVVAEALLRIGRAREQLARGVAV